MKKTKTTKTAENTAHKNALVIAKTIEDIMGKDFFTIEQMRKKMVVTKDKNHSRLSWNDARNYITSIANYGLAEALPAVKDCYKIRLDHEFQLNYFDKQIDIRNAEIEVYKQIQQQIFNKDEVSELPVKQAKNKAVKKAK